MENYFDPTINVPRIRTKRKPVLIKLKPLAGTRNTIVQPDKCAHPNSERIDKYIQEVTIAPIKIPYMHMTHERNPLPSQGIEYVHDLFSTRNMIFIHRAFEMVLKEPASVRYSLWMWINSALQKMSLLMCYNNDGIGRVLKGVYYVPRIGLEASPLHYLRVAARDVFKLLSYISEKRGDVIVGTGSANSIQLPNSSVDYIFVDPPFGGFQLYSDLNFLWESFIKLFTNRHDEVIVDQVQDKGVGEYHYLIRDSFKECYRVLKSGHWMTLKFHNSSSTIWHTIQNSLYEAGFIVANVSASDKKLGTTKQISDASTVRQDLIISVYKPLEKLEERGRLDIGNESSAWNFIRAHLENLPIITIKGKKLEVVSERTEYLLYDRMIAFHIQRGLTVPLSSVEFFTGLSERFAERDGMYFLPNQAIEYDKKRLSVENVVQLKLFVSDEPSARQWLREQIRQKPQTFQELHPQFIKEIGGWSKNEKPLELSILLEQNFLSYNGNGPVPEQIHAYLSTNWKELRNLPKDDPTLVAKARDRWYVPDPNKAGDLEKLREKALLKEFEVYKESKGKLKVFRLEAVRAAFKKAWQERDYALIVAVANKIPNNVLEEDPKLLMWYDQAVTRMGGE